MVVIFEAILGREGYGRGLELRRDCQLEVEDGRMCRCAIATV